MATTTLRLDTEIFEDSANVLRTAIAAVKPEDRIELRINSPGGSIFSGQMLLAALQAHKGGVDTIIESLGASMAGVLFMAGESRVMAKGSRLMVHEPWTSMSGDADDLRKSADLLDSLKRDIINVFTAKSGLSAERVAELMSEETWMDADTAVALGFATGVFGDAKNAIDVDALGKFGFKNIPAELVKKPEPDSLPVNVIELQATVVNLKAKLKERTSERNAARDALAQTKTLLAALKRSYGIGAAQVVANVPFDGEALGGTIVEQFESIQDPEAKSRFYKQHEAELRNFINKPSPSNSASRR